MTGFGQGITAPDIGRRLRDERMRQGLSLRDVSARIGVPQDQLRAAETGSLAPRDELTTLKTVRRYADLLGLPGDRYALAILEHWPTRGNAVRKLAAYEPRADGEATAAVRLGAASSDTPTAAAGLGGPVAPATPTQISSPPLDPRAPVAAPDATATGAWSPVPWSGAAWSGGVLSDTGVAPAVPAHGDHLVRARRRRSAPPLLRATIMVVVLALVAGVAVLAVDRLRPSWLHDIGLARARVAAAISPSAPPAAVAKTRAEVRRSHGAGTLGMHKTSATSAVVDTRSPGFSIVLSASGGPCWVQVSPIGSSPLFAGTIEAGGARTFHSSHTLVVELGSTAGRLAVESKSGHLVPTAPPRAPYKVTVRTA